MTELSNQLDCVGSINCDIFKPGSIDFYLAIKKLHRDSYTPLQKIVLSLTQDYYAADPAGIVLQSIQRILNIVDISNFFVHIVTTNPDAHNEYQWVNEHISTDSVPVNIQVVDGDWKKIYQHKEKVFLGIDVPRNNLEIENLSTKHRGLLENSKVFCILPWTSMFIQTDSKVKPCCESTEIIGDCSQQTLKEIWNGSAIKKLRADMLAGEKIESCKKCYFLEDNLKRRNSPRQEYLREFAQHIPLVDNTNTDGSYDDFKLSLLNLKYSNLCNLSCRMCDPINSTAWHAPAVAINRIEPNEKIIKIAGNKKIDVLSQIYEHLADCQQILFEGGEPLMIEEFWSILEELDRRKRYDVKLSYNSNLTQYKLKGRSIFDLWNKFENVNVAASLDAEGARGEYLRPGAKWEDIVNFRTEMMQHAPNAYIEIQSTVTIFNVLHLPDFHKSWVEKGFIQPSQWRIHFLYAPNYMSILTLPQSFHAIVREKYLNHIKWLRPLDPFGRATSTFESVVSSLENSTPFDADDFWKNTKQLDQYYNVDFLEVFPELQNLPRI